VVLVLPEAVLLLGVLLLGVLLRQGIPRHRGILRHWGILLHQGILLHPGVLFLSLVAGDCGVSTLLLHLVGRVGPVLLLFAGLLHLLR